MWEPVHCGGIIPAWDPGCVYGNWAPAGTQAPLLRDYRSRMVSGFSSPRLNFAGTVDSAYELGTSVAFSPQVALVRAFHHIGKDAKTVGQYFIYGSFHGGCCF